MFRMVDLIDLSLWICEFDGEAILSFLAVGTPCFIDIFSRSLEADISADDVSSGVGLNPTSRANLKKWPSDWIDC